MSETVLNNAKSYLGVTQGSGKHKALIDQYNAVKPLPVGYKMTYTDSWCAAFVTVIGDISGASSQIGRECGVQRFINIFKNKGIWLGRVKPKAGDIITFDWDADGWADHIGFVEKVNGNVVTTIEGNSSKQVARRSYTWGDSQITGYARPKYPNSSSNKSIAAIAQEVIQGKWGNGTDRKKRLTKAGYNAQTVQTEVNRLMKNQSNKKSNEAIAREVIQGKWGNGQTRKERLAAAGYNYEAVQKIVNRAL